MLKDHLGNVRMVLTDEVKQDMYPAATMEAAQTTTEELLYANLNTTRVDNPVGYPVDNTTNPNNKVAKVSAAVGSQKVGPSITLKVMAGDKFNLKVSSWYKTNGVTPAAPVSPLPDLIAALINGVSGASGGKADVTQLENSAVLTPGATSFLSSQTPAADRPKAYLNWILFDEQFKFVASNSSFEQVPAETAFGTIPNQTVYKHVKNDLAIDKSGYLYVYVSNETPNIDVFFDNLQVTHMRGALLSEHHYMPFGLTMSGISSKAAGGFQNKIGITGKEMQNKEFSDGSGLEEYDFGARFYDQQIGRWNSIDPHVANYYGLSPYNYCNNNPIKYLDPSGMDPETSTVEKPKDLPEVAVYSKKRQNNSLANRAFPWANDAAKPEAKLWTNRQQTYQQARFKGWTKADMWTSWSKKGVSEDDLIGFERFYEAETYYRNFSLVSVGVLAAPIVAVTAPEIFAGTASLRLASAGTEAIGQYAINAPQYGLGLNNLQNINVAPIFGNLLVPKSSLASAVIGNVFKSTYKDGYSGVSSNASGAYIITNIGLSYLGNKVGGVHGSLIGNGIGNGSQAIFDMYYNLNK